MKTRQRAIPTRTWRDRSAFADKNTNNNRERDFWRNNDRDNKGAKNDRPRR